MDIEKRLRKMVAIAAKKPGHGKHQLYAEIYNNHDERVAFGWNHAGRSDLIAHYVRHDKVDGTCAEAAAVIYAISKYHPLTGTYMLVARAKKPFRGGPIVPGLAQPCEGCQRLMADYGIQSYYYTTDDGYTGTLNAIEDKTCD